MLPQIISLLDETNIMRMEYENLTEQERAMQNNKRLVDLANLFDRIVVCLTEHLIISDNYYLSTTSMVIISENNQVTLDVSLYGPVAALFWLEPEPVKLTNCIAKCLAHFNILLLTTDERDELNEQGRYYELF